MARASITHVLEEEFSEATAFKTETTRDVAMLPQ